MRLTKYNTEYGMYVVWTPFDGNESGGVFTFIGGIKERNGKTVCLIKKDTSFEVELSKLRMATLDEIKAHVGH